MLSVNDILLIIKYVIVVAIFAIIVLTPAYLAAANDKSKYDRMRARMGSWMFGWSFIGWIFALFIGAKK